MWKTPCHVFNFLIFNFEFPPYRGMNTVDLELSMNSNLIVSLSFGDQIFVVKIQILTQNGLECRSTFRHILKNDRPKKYIHN